MKNITKLAFVLSAALVSQPSFSQSGPPVDSPNTINELFDFLAQCIDFPPGSEGSELTLRFSLTPVGMLRGKPMVTYSKLTGTPEIKKQFVASTMKAVENCTPAPMTEHFGKVAAQKMILWRVGN